MSEIPPVQPSPFGSDEVELPVGMAIASMVLGIVGLALFCLWYVSIPCAILAIVLGAIARKKATEGTGGGKGKATAGIVCGAISIGIVVLFLVGCLAIIGIGASTGAFDEIKEEIEREMQKQQGTTAPGALLEPIKDYVLSWLA
ncbi:MAG: DUF4190 domain-containing protein [Planctomycetota bacterium]|jgi:hypothetical protein